MDRKWKNLKQRLGFKSIVKGCCGGTWNTRPRISTISILDEDEHHHHHHQTPRPQQVQQLVVVPTVTSASGMNLAMALAAERNLRPNNNVGPSNPRDEVKTLMRLIEETEGVDWAQEQDREDDDSRVVGIAEGAEWMCCVCMERKKGSAFIPCGHTFCRVCSREMWLNRGSCPVCNRSILDVLDIF